MKGLLEVTLLFLKRKGLSPAISIFFPSPREASLLKVIDWFVKPEMGLDLSVSVLLVVKEKPPVSGLVSVAGADWPKMLFLGGSELEGAPNKLPAGLEDGPVVRENPPTLLPVSAALGG
jgi:hypothetical protein